MRAHALNLREQAWRYTYPSAEPEFVAGLFLLKCPWWKAIHFLSYFFMILKHVSHYFIEIIVQYDKKTFAILRKVSLHVLSRGTHMNFSKQTFI